jgi:CubicO group peptidase (beta-lactamase class C family)
MRDLEVPGASVAVIDHEKIAWSKGYGVLEEGKEKSVDTETIFQAASISKPFTALGILSLVKTGRIKLDANVNDYLLSWKVPENSFTKDEKVTIRRLLSHTAGLTDGNGFPGYQAGTPIPSLREILRGRSPSVNSAPIVVGTTPGSFFQYSGGGYEILQLLIEDVTQQPFEKFMTQTILAPLEMTHSTFDYPLPEDLSSNTASAHNGKKVVEGKWHIYPEKGAAALWTTPTDIAKMIISVHNCVQGKAEEKGLSKILGRALCQEMLTMHKWPLQNGRTREVGLGFMGSQDQGATYFNHGGSNEGIICNFRGFTSSNNLHGTVIMTNSSRGIPLTDELEKTIDDVYGWEVYKPIERKIADIKFEVLKKLIGTSYVGPRFTVSVIEREGHLAVIDSRDNPPEPIDLFPERETSFFDLQGGRHEFTTEEYVWTPPGSNPSVTFKKLTNNDDL